MLFLLLQTFAWMTLFFLLGAVLGCVGRRTLDAGEVAGRLAPAGLGAATAATAVARAPVVEASKAPPRVTPAAPATVPGAAVLPAPYSYPITTVGIPRGMPEPIQPQIQKIELVPVAPVTVAAGAAAAAAVAYPAATGVASAPSGTVRPHYPITTIGIPPAYPTPAPPSTPTAAALNAAKADTLGYERAQAAQSAAAAQQPRPEPLRPELARGTAVPAAVAAGTPAPAAAPVTATPAKSATPDEQPFTPVMASTAAVAALAARASAQSQPADSAGDDLMRIRAIDATLHARLKSAGVSRFSEIARWSPSDVARVSQALGLVGRIEQENWIEQAQILASGGETDYSRRRLRGEIPAAPVPAAPAQSPSQPAPTQLATPPQTPPSQPANVTLIGQAAAAASAAATVAAAAATRATDPAVNTPMATRLSDAIQANARPAGSAAAADPAKGSRPDLSGLRSVRSEALRGDVTASETLRNGGSARPVGAFDDLKRIRGIGVLIEKKLNSLGVATYEQVANWTNADIDRVSQILDFKGRIERESWVEQARILASGGHTEFSRRVDRGEA